MRKTAVFAALLSLTCLSSYATEAPQHAGTKTLAADEAYVLVDMGAKGPLRHYVSSLTFSHSQANIKLSVPPEKGLQLVKVKAGTYKPEKFGIGQKAKRSGDFAIAADKKGIFVEPGTVTYIGNWDIYYGQQVRVNDQTIINDKKGYRISYSVDNLVKYAEKNEWIKGYPLRVSHINGKRVANSWDIGNS